MNLVDWGNIAGNALWILGLGIALAAVSYTDWRASTVPIQRRVAFSAPSFLAPFNLGLTLFAAGFIYQNRQTWEAVLWAVLTCIFVISVFVNWRARDQNVLVDEHDDKIT